MKKKLFIKKNEKKIYGAELEWATAQLYFKRMKLYCNTGIRIAVRNLGWAMIVLQYTGLYCSDGG